MIPFIERQLATTKRVDVILGRKATTRQRREQEPGMRHDGNGTFPKHWNSCLQNISNRVELFHYLSLYISQTVFCEGKIVIPMSTLDENVLGSLVLCQALSSLNIHPCHTTMRISILERCCMQRMQSETVLDYILRDPVSL